MSQRLLCVVAHPDDECFAFGGALALAARRGVEVSVVCLTDGQAAANRGSAESAAELGRIRREEFARSCKVLGVTHFELLDHQDAQLEFLDFSKAAGEIVQRIRAFRPQVVVTFGLDGALNTHPDHTMVSAITGAAFHWAASAKRYPKLGPIHHAERLFVRSAGFTLEGRPAPMPIPWTLALDVREVLDVQLAALREHESQAPLMEQTKDLFIEHGKFEHYTLTAAREPQAAKQLDDMFSDFRLN
jgi:LmbE family N-acetylglucosaminyl deacetylase